LKKTKPYDYKRFVISASRLIFFRSPIRRAVAKRCFVSKGLYVCELCKKPTDKIQVDHIKPIGLSKDWNEFFEFLFCSLDELQGICKSCHDKKTTKDKNEMRKTHGKRKT